MKKVLQFALVCSLIICACNKDSSEVGVLDKNLFCENVANSSAEITSKDILEELDTEKFSTIKFIDLDNEICLIANDGIKYISKDSSLQVSTFPQLESVKSATELDDLVYILANEGLYTFNPYDRFLNLIIDEQFIDKFSVLKDDGIAYYNSSDKMLKFYNFQNQTIEEKFNYDVLRDSLGQSSQVISADFVKYLKLYKENNTLKVFSHIEVIPSTDISPSGNLNRQKYFHSLILNDSIIENERLLSANTNIQVLNFNSNEVYYKLRLQDYQNKFIAENPFNPTNNFELDYSFATFDRLTTKGDLLINLDEVSSEDDILQVYDLNTKELLYDLNIKSFDRLYSDYTAMNDGIMIYFGSTKHALLLDYETGCIIREISFEIEEDYSVDLQYFDDKVLIKETINSDFFSESFLEGSLEVSFYED